MKQATRRALMLSLAAVLATPTVRGDARPAGVTTDVDDSNICGEIVVYGRLVVTDAEAGAFVLQGYGDELIAPDTVDVSVLDGMLVRVDFDDECRVRSVVRAERLEGPAIET